MSVTQRDVIEACHRGVRFATMAVCLAAGPAPCVAAGTDIPNAPSISLNGAWRLKGWPTPDRGSVRTLE